MTSLFGREQQVLIDSCVKHGVPFIWRGAGTLLIAKGGIRRVLEDVTASGFVVVGLEGFEVGNVELHPRLDLIFDASRREADPVSVVEEWSDNVWIDVTLNTRDQG